jgi:peptidoglycan/xylan/chitin deacetylase (PgdA/CDA1 family)/cellulose synthase/poly-beta-1,6-N-acetylglucosamine synthase-like glycosyltransferase
VGALIGISDGLLGLPRALGTDRMTLCRMETRRGGRDETRTRPRLRSAVAVVGWLGLTTVMLIGVFVNRMTAWGRPHPGPDVAAPAPAKPVVSIPDDRSAVLDFSRAGAGRSPVRPKRTVALTFEDGPDPRWTPKVLEVLKRHNAKATFFVVGARVNEHSDMVRATLAAGHDVGNHTFTHASVSNSPSWRNRVELSLTNVALTRAGTTTRIMRPPNSALASSLTIGDLEAAKQSGYLVVLTDAVAPDQTDTSVDDIVASVLPSGDTGAIITFHDGGANQQRTVDALEKLLTTLEAREFQFVTVSQYAGLATGAALTKPSAVQRVGAFAVVAVATLSGWLSILALAGALALIVLALVRAIVLIVLSRRNMLLERQRRILPATAELPSMTVVLRAAGDSDEFDETVRALSGSNYPRFDVIVMDGGSLTHVEDRIASLTDAAVIAHRGTAATALNAALEFATGQVVVMIEPGTLLDAGALRAFAAPFLIANVGAVTGTVRVVHAGGLIGRFQHLDAALANAERPMYNEAGSALSVPMAAGAYRRQALHDVGGIPTDTLAWNTDLTMALQRAGWKIGFAPDARAWADGPSTWREVWREHDQLTSGTLQALTKHRSRVHTEGPGPRLGQFVFRFGFASLLIAALAPLAAMFLALSLLQGRFWTALAVWGALTAVSLAVAAFAFRLDGERYRNLWIVPVRQLMLQLAMGSALVASAGRWLRGRRTVPASKVTTSFQSQRLPDPVATSERSERVGAQPVSRV